MTNNFTPIIYRVKVRLLVLLAILCSLSTLGQQTARISGKVTSGDNDGPLSGVSVMVKGSAVGTTTAGDGSYSIAAGRQDSLVFSIIGYAEMHLAVGNRTTVNTSLQNTASGLNEVVVVGYGVQKRKDLVGSVGVASGKDFGDRAVGNVAQMIQGQIAGVQVVNSSGTPGSGSSIVVRGTGSFTNTSPLYVIDGIQTSEEVFNSLSPYDIQEITVLKDASSVAIYGAQGANGVVIISTKLPKTGAPRVTYDGYVGFSQPWKKFDLMNAAEYTGLVKDYFTNSGRTLPIRVNTPDALVTRTDWQDEIFRTGKLTEHHLNVGGGAESVRYSFSAGYTKQESMLTGLTFQRANLRLNLTETLGKRLKFGQQINVSYRMTNGVQADISSAMRMPPYVPVYDPTNLLGGFGLATSILDANDATNPLIVPSLYDQKSKGLNNYLQLFGEVDILPGLKFRSQLGGSFNFHQNYNYNPTYAGNQLITFNNIVEGYDYGLNYILENYFTYNKTIKKSAFTITAGNSYREGGIFRSIQVTGSTFPNTEIHQIGVAKTQNITGAAANSQPRFISYFARANYTLMDKYILTLTGRRDATSLFSPDERVGYFPSAGLGWRLSEEKFMKNISWINDVKLRGSWGRTGNSNISGFRYQSNVWTGQANSIVYSLGPGEALVNGATVAVPSSPDLKWETTTTTDAGIDAVLFQHKLSLSLGYYYRKNEDLLVSVPIPPSRGYGGTGGNASSQLINAASAFNRGYELSLGYTNKAGAFTYSLKANGAYNYNEVISLGTQGAVPVIDGGFYGVPAMTRTEPGHPIGAFYGYVYDHVAIDAADIEKYNAMARSKSGNAAAVYQSGLLPGDRLFSDVNGDGVLTAADQKFLGSSIPKFTYGMNLGLGYKNFDFMASLQGISGVQYINAFKYYSEGFALPFNGKNALLDAWKKPGDITDHSRIGQNTSVSANFRNSSWFVEDGDFMRLRNVTIGYTVKPSTIRSYTGNTVNNIRLYVTAQNLLTFTGYSGYDPEVTGTGNFIFARGIDTGQNPQPRSFTFGAQVGF